MCRKARCSFHNAPSEFTIPAIKIDLSELCDTQTADSSLIQFTISLQDACQFRVRTTGKDGLAKGFTNEMGIAEDDDSFPTQKDLIDRTKSLREAGEGEMEVLVEEWQKSQQRDAPRTGRQAGRGRGTVAESSEQESDDEDDCEEAEAEAGEKAEVEVEEHAVRCEREDWAAVIAHQSLLYDKDKPLVSL